MQILSVVLCLWAAGTHGAVIGTLTRGSSQYRVTNLSPPTASHPRAADPASTSFDPVVLDEKLQPRAAADGYWMNDLSGKGIAPFNSNPAAYKVFRNVLDYGAKGKSVTAHTEA